ncbi:hypothetical protein ASF39_19780 [Methylobacterium sp. Leaf108]|nr:hypothetical protein ASF39_19780 [Methylobacterium sp. Leaf108]
MRPNLVTLATLGLLLGTGTAVSAAEDGLGGLFQRLFSPEPSALSVQPPQPTQQADTAPQGRSFAQKRYDARRYAQRLQATRPRPNIRYASLPKPKTEPLKILISDRQVPLDMTDGPAAAFLKDKTLRPGDIVVLKDGARVFTGKPDKPHSIKDFENIGRSDFIDRRTRHLLTAMMVPVGAMTVAEVRKRMLESNKGLPSLVTTPVQLQTSSIRVIYPSFAAR